MTRKMKRVRRWCAGIGAALLTGTGLCCAIGRMAAAGVKPSFAIAAAEMTMPTGQAAYQQVSAVKKSEVSALSVPEPAAVSKEEPSSTVSQPSVPVMKEVPAEKKQTETSAAPDSQVFEASQATEEEIVAYDKAHEGEEQYPVYEMTITEGNCHYGNVQVRNTASTDIDIAAELQGALGFTIEQTDQPQVLIYHTHTSESYLTYDTGYFYESFFPRSTERSESVCAVGEEITKQLNAAGIVTLHDTTLHDYPSYSGAYDRSLATIEEYLEKYPTIKVVLDIHRDGIGTDTEKHKPVFELDGHKGAQMMILAGYNYDDSEEFRDWEYNLRFALRLQQAAANKCPELVRPVNFSDFMYNMNVNTGSLLIEVGAEANTLEEARYTGYCLGQVLAEVLQADRDEKTKATGSGGS